MRCSPNVSTSITLSTLALLPMNKYLQKERRSVKERRTRGRGLRRREEVLLNVCERLAHLLKIDTIPVEKS